MTRHYAHSLEGRPTGEWEGLEEHLERVAELAGEFAGRFGAAEWGREVRRITVEVRER